MKMQRATLIATVWLLSELLLLLVLCFTDLSFSEAATWARYDSTHYREIASGGYTFFTCDPQSSEWCGNAGWFPGYPLLIRALSASGMNGILAAALLSRLFFLGMLWVFSLLLSIEKWSRSAFLTLFSVSVFFGAIYYKAAFPVSAVLFWGLLASYFVWKGRFLPAAAIAALAAFFYPTGFLFSAAFGLFALLQGGWKRSVLFKQVLPFAIAAVMGMATAFWVIWLDTGVWDAFIKVQAKYGHGFQNPVKNVGILAKQIDVSGFHLKDVPRYQSLLIIACFFALSWFSFRNRQKMDRLDKLAVTLMACFFLFPWLVGGNLSLYRAESLLLPALLLTRNWAPVSKMVVLGLLLFFFLPMSYLFFTAVLI